ncbi:hypothetical protein I6M46_07410 [Shewanella algae]|uniref:hypothetical protein n=1 Tax=Shewanella algae TaxID=38313 RepID=UPI001AAE9BE0|nr:hypothetical protein [Shewanella algae]MBO2628117.1 hypothetical protein [Shewanella algae]
MAWTIDNALEDEAIEKAKKTEDGFSIWLKGIPLEIKIELSINGTRGGYNYHLSHAIKTPDQIDAYRSSNPWGDYDAYALHKAVSAITQHYNVAIKNGHIPSESWLVKY